MQLILIIHSFTFEAITPIELTHGHKEIFGIKIEDKIIISKKKSENLFF